MALPPFVGAISDAAFADGAVGTLGLAVSVAPLIQDDVESEFTSRLKIKQPLSRDQAAFVQRWAGAGARLRFVPSGAFVSVHPDLAAIRTLSVRLIQRHLRRGMSVLLLSSTYQEWRDFYKTCPGVRFDAAVHFSGPKDQARWLASIDEARAETNEEVLASGVPQQVSSCDPKSQDFRGATFYPYRELSDLRRGYDMVVCVDGVLDFQRVDFDAAIREVSGGRAMFTMHYAPEALDITDEEVLTHPWFKHKWSRQGSWLTMNTMDGACPYTHSRRICKSWWRHNVSPMGVYEALYANAGYGAFQYFGGAAGRYQRIALRFYPGTWLRIVDVQELLVYNRWRPIYVDGEKFDTFMRYLLQVLGGGGEFDVAKAYGFIRGNLGQVSTTSRVISGQWFLADADVSNIVVYAILMVSLTRARFADTFKMVGRLMRSDRRLSWIFRNMEAPWARFCRTLSELFNGRPVYDILMDYQKGWDPTIRTVRKTFEKSSMLVLGYAHEESERPRSDEAAAAREAFDSVFLPDYNAGFESHAAKKLRQPAFAYLEGAKCVYHYGWHPGGQMQLLAGATTVVCISAMRPASPALRPWGFEWHDVDISAYAPGPLHMKKPSVKIVHEVAVSLGRHIAEDLPKGALVFADVSCCSGFAHDGARGLCRHPLGWLAFWGRYVRMRKLDLTLKVNTPDLEGFFEQVLGLIKSGIKVRYLPKQTSNPASFEQYVRLRCRLFPRLGRVDVDKARIKFWQTQQLAIAYHRQRDAWVNDVLRYGHHGRVVPDGFVLEVDGAVRGRDAIHYAEHKVAGKRVLVHSMMRYDRADTSEDDSSTSSIASSDSSSSDSDSSSSSSSASSGSFTVTDLSSSDSDSSDSSSSASSGSFTVTDLSGSSGDDDTSSTATTSSASGSSTATETTTLARLFAPADESRDESSTTSEQSATTSSASSASASGTVGGSSTSELSDESTSSATSAGASVTSVESVGSGAAEGPIVRLVETLCIECTEPCANVCRRCRVRGVECYVCKGDHARVHNAWHDAGGKVQVPQAPRRAAVVATRPDVKHVQWPLPAPGWSAIVPKEYAIVEADYLPCAITADGRCAVRAAAALVHGDEMPREGLGNPRSLEKVDVIPWLSRHGILVLEADEHGHPTSFHGVVPARGRPMPFGLVWLVAGVDGFHCHVLVKVTPSASGHAQQHPYVRHSRAPNVDDVLNNMAPVRMWSVMQARPRDIYEAFATQVESPDYEGKDGGSEMRKQHEVAATMLRRFARTLPTIAKAAEIETMLSVCVGAPGSRKTETAVDAIHSAIQRYGVGKVLYIAPSKSARDELESRYRQKYHPDKTPGAKSREMGFYAKTFVMAIVANTRDGYAVPSGTMRLVLIDEAMRWSYYYVLILAGLFSSAALVLLGDPQQLGYDSRAQWNLPDERVYVSEALFRKDGQVGLSLDLKKTAPAAVFDNNVTSRFGPRLVAFLRSREGGLYDIFCDNVKAFDVRVVDGYARDSDLYMVNSVKPYYDQGWDILPVTIASAQGLSVDRAAVLVDKATAATLTNVLNWPAARLVALTRARSGLTIVTRGMAFWPRTHANPANWIKHLSLGKPSRGSRVGGTSTVTWQDDAGGLERNFTPEPGSGADGGFVRVIQPQGRFGGVEYWHQAREGYAASTVPRADTEIIVTPLEKASRLSRTEFNQADLYELEQIGDGTPFIHAAQDLPEGSSGEVFVRTGGVVARNFEARVLMDTDHGFRHHARSERQLIQTVMARTAAAAVNAKKAPKVPGTLVADIFANDLCDPVAREELLNSPYVSVFGEEAANEFRARMKPYQEVQADFTVRDSGQSFGVFLKAQMKVADFGKTFENAKYGQPIVTADKDLQFIYGHLSRVGKKVLDVVLRKCFVMVAGYSEDKLAEFWAAATAAGWTLMTDYTSFETAHTPSANGMLLLAYVSVIPGAETMQEYFDITQGSRAGNNLLRFLAKWLGSGTPWTWLSNTTLQLLFTGLAGRAGPMGKSWWQAVTVALIGGDDNTMSLTKPPKAVFDFEVVNAWLHSPIKMIVRQGNLGEFGNWLFRDGLCCYALEKLIKKVMNKNMAQVLSREVEWDAYILGVRNVMMQYRRNLVEISSMNAEWHGWTEDRASSLAICVDAFCELSHSRACEILRPIDIFYTDCAD